MHARMLSARGERGAFAPVPAHGDQIHVVIEFRVACDVVDAAVRAHLPKRIAHVGR